MAYKRITIMDVSEIIRRRHDGQKITHIANVLDFDRKTVRKYISKVDVHCDGADISSLLVLSPTEKLCVVKRPTHSINSYLT